MPTIGAQRLTHQARLITKRFVIIIGIVIGRGPADGSAGGNARSQAQIIPLKENDTVEIFLGPDSPPEQIISSADFARNLTRLAQYVTAAR
jgi:hypothetical protein